MTARELANKLNTEENRKAYHAADEKLMFVQELIEAENITIHPGSSIIEYVEDVFMGIK